MVVRGREGAPAAGQRQVLPHGEQPVLGVEQESSCLYHYAIFALLDTAPQCENQLG